VLEALPIDIWQSTVWGRLGSYEHLYVVNAATMIRGASRQGSFQDINISSALVEIIGNVPRIVQRLLDTGSTNLGTAGRTTAT